MASYDNDMLQEDLERQALLQGLQQPAGKPSPVPSPSGDSRTLPYVPAPEASEKPKSSIYQSDNKSLSGYLQEAAAAYRPELIKFGSDAERKAAAESYIRSLEPEMRARGWKGGEIKNEKYQDNGRWYDLYRDVDGAAEAQHLDVTDDGAQRAMPMGGGPSSFQGIQSLMPTDTGFYNELQAKLQQILGGPQAFDREALLQQLMKGSK
jgi:hypothetical protein